ncbi:hypothetical protein BN874_910010 [Candidatus Contendobacter odensis Run_B_J11]|uniref:Uncharacterized protein n=1 Tax=Candidatus Contendobacter odensis Run_B_J11 TaxID=1400861 RepID=A0A7U7GGM5_9GAMM|nr:hypothetical protein BN874_910010 [Candidatus Contendobacter odensis Run_B_J11]
MSHDDFWLALAMPSVVQLTRSGKVRASGAALHRPRTTADAAIFSPPAFTRDPGQSHYGVFGTGALNQEAHPVIITEYGAEFSATDTAA